jgi:hypothetical protein
MGTRSRIGYELPDHSVVSVYCHWDGYVEGNGRILVEHYQDREAVKKLIDGGSMSSLRTRRNGWDLPKPLKDENGNYISDAEGNMMYENDRDPQPLYFAERGEELDVQHTSFDEFCSDMCGEEYAYLYDLNGNWKAYQIGWGKEPTERVDIPGYMTA